MAKKPTSNDPRRAKLAEMRAEQKAAERRRSMIFIIVAVVVGLGLIAAAAIPIIRNNMQANRALGEFGVSAADASCGEIITEPTTGSNDHVGQGTPSPDVTRVEYATSPPSSGQHYAYNAGFERNFYDRDDTPVLEELVHNLEHGATIIWYDEEVTDEEISELKLLADKLTSDVDPKVIVAAWDSEDRGAFPEGHVALSHWGAETGHRQYCEQVSGEAINAFVVEYPYADSPEPNAW